MQADTHTIGDQQFHVAERPGDDVAIFSGAGQVLLECGYRDSLGFCPVEVQEPGDYCERHPATQ